MLQLKNNDDKEKIPFAEKLSGFLQKYRRVFAVCVCVIFAGIVIYGLVDYISGNKTEKAIAEVADIAARWETMRADSSAGDRFEREDEMLGELALIAKKNRNFGGTRAYMLCAEIYFDRQAWPDAESAYNLAARNSPRAYTAPLCLFNAGVCAEEKGDFDAAAQYYRQSAENKSFPMAARAMFSIGRIKEAQGLYADACEAYEKLADAYPYDEWTNIAKSRSLYLQAEGLVD